MARVFISCIAVLFSLGLSTSCLADNTYRAKASPRYSYKPAPVKAVRSQTPSSSNQESFVAVNSRGEVYMPSIPQAFRNLDGTITGRNQRGDVVYYSLDPELHSFTKELVRVANADHVAVVAMDPHSGRVLTMGEKSRSLKHPVLHNGYPAASLFKIVTTAAALETSSMKPYTSIAFRGGTYQLDKRNYSVNPKLDKRYMTVTSALGKSCNPVFSRVALRFLNSNKLKAYAEKFVFNNDLQFDIPLAESLANIPNDSYGLGRTAAGFGDVTITPVHAAAIMSAIANKGQMPRPFVVQKVETKDKQIRYLAKPKNIYQVVRADTAQTILKMMEATIKDGTGKKDFYYKGRPLLRNIRVAAKTGTLRGKNPIGMNRWFIAAAPIENPKIALAVLTINPINTQARPGYIGKKLIEKYLAKK